MEAVLELAKRLRIDVIMSFACDPGVVTAAYVAEKLGIPSTGPYDSVALLQDKGRFRDFLRRNGFRVPSSKSYERKEEAMGDAFTFPVIVKPVDSAGSKGVSRADSMEELSAAIDKALTFTRCHRFIIEDFIQQKGFASDTECFSVDGELRFVTWNNQYFDAQADNPYTPAGFTWPSTMEERHQRELTAELQRLLRLLHMGSTVYNVEARVGTDDKPYLMEVSPRGGGNRLCEMVQFTTGAPLIRNAVKAALGMELEPMEGPHYSGHWSYIALHSYESGLFRGLELDEGARAALRDEDLWVRTGDRVEAFSGANKTIGTLVFDWPSQEERDRRMGNIPAWLKVLVEVEA